MEEVINLSNYTLLGRRYEVEKKPYQVAFVIQPKLDVTSQNEKAFSILELKPDLKSINMTNTTFRITFSGITIRIEPTNPPFHNGFAKIPSVGEEVPCRLISPMSSSFVERHGRQKQLMVESPDAYSNFSQHYIKFINRGHSKWLRNILNGEAERDSILYPKFDGTDEINPKAFDGHKFILISDPEWEFSDPKTVNFNAFFLDETIRSVRDLTSEHIKLLKQIRAQGLETVNAKLKENCPEITMTLHYHPTDFPLHIHFTTKNPNERESEMELGKVIQNLESNSKFYSEASLQIFCRIPELCIASTFFEYCYRFEYSWIARYLQIFIEATEYNEMQEKSPDYDLVWKVQKIKILFLKGKYFLSHHEPSCPFSKLEDKVKVINKNRCIHCGDLGCKKFHSNQLKFKTVGPKKVVEMPDNLHALFCDWSNVRYCGNHSKESFKALNYIASIAQEYYKNQLEIFSKKFDQKIYDSQFDQSKTSTSYDSSYTVQLSKDEFMQCSSDINQIKESIASYNHISAHLDNFYKSHGNIDVSAQALDPFLELIP